MRKSLALLALLPGIAYSQPAPCNQNNVIMSATLAGTPFDNRATKCTTWIFRYFANGFSALSVQLESAPDVNGTPGAFSVIPASLISTNSSNPLTNTAAATLSFNAFVPWLRVHLTSMAGTGSINYSLTGYVVSANVLIVPAAAQIPFPAAPVSNELLALKAGIGGPLPGSITSGSGGSFPIAAAQFSTDIPSGAQNYPSVGGPALNLYARSATNNFPVGGVGANGGVSAVGLRIETFNSAALGAQWGIASQQNGCDRNCGLPGAIAVPTQYKIGFEADNRNHLAGSFQDTGVWVINKSTFSPANSDAFRADWVNNQTTCGPGGSAGACVPWRNGFRSVWGAASVGLMLEQDGSGTASLPGQSIQWKSFNAAGGTLIGRVRQEFNGDLTYQAANNSDNTRVAHTFIKSGVGDVATIGSNGSFSTAGDVFTRGTIAIRTDTASGSWPADAFRSNAAIEETVSAAGVTMTTPTAAEIVSQVTSGGAECFGGASWNLLISNVGGVDVLGIAAGASVTFRHVAPSLAPGQKTTLLIIVTNCAAGSEAVIMLGSGVTT